MTWVVGGLGTAKIDVLVLERSLLQGSEYSNPPPRQCTVLREIEGSPKKHPVWGGDSGLPWGLRQGGCGHSTGFSSGACKRGALTGRVREGADMISSSFPSIVLRPDGSASCFPSRRWGKPRVAAERRSRDLGSELFAPDALLNPFRDPERQIPAQSPFALPQAQLFRASSTRPSATLRGWRDAAVQRGKQAKLGNVRLLPRGGGRALASQRPSSPLGWGSIQPGAQDRLGLGGRSSPLCSHLLCPGD